MDLIGCDSDLTPGSSGGQTSITNKSSLVLSVE
jgi:hypothetical protein